MRCACKWGSSARIFGPFGYRKLGIDTVSGLKRSQKEREDTAVEMIRSDVNTTGLAPMVRCHQTVTLFA